MQKEDIVIAAETRTLIQQKYGRCRVVNVEPNLRIQFDTRPGGLHPRNERLKVSPWSVMWNSLQTTIQH
jgi:hypothetical protein